MHSAVLQSKDYIKFADKSTVEVISLGSLQQGIDAKDRKATTFEGERDGQKVELLTSWPSLTVQEMLDLNSSPGGQFNKTGKIPYLSIVDPFTQQEVSNILGGTSGKTIMTAVKEAQKKLTQEHGRGVSRDELNDLTEAERSVVELTGQGEFAKAIDALEKGSKNLQEWPQALQDRVAKARQQIVAGAEQALAGVETLVETDPVAARREISKLQSRLKGTGLEGRIDELKGGL